MQVKEVMSRRIIAVSPEESVAVAARLLSQHNIGALPVCSRDGRLVGMVSLGDVAVRPDYTMEAGEALQEISQNIRRV